MSFLIKAMANTLGIGGAKIDTIIKNEELKPGEILEGICRIKGGKIEQDISDIMLYVKTSYKKEYKDKKSISEVITQKECININKSIKEDEIVEIPFKFKLLLHTPISLHKSKVWISTSLAIENAIDAADRDYIKVLPNEYINNVLEAINNLGFTMREVENEYYRNRFQNLPFVQEFEFVAHRGEFRRKLDELEVFFILNETSVEVFLEIDRSARSIGGLFMEELGLDESVVRLSFDYNDIKDIDYLMNKIYLGIKSKI